VQSFKHGWISSRRSKKIAAAGLVILLLMISRAGLPQPSTITVNTLSDSSTSSDGLCSLREAINNANNAGTDTTGGDCVVGSGTDTINFSISGTVTLTVRCLPL
jgi:CSLREA domain-containing protein